MKDDLYASSIEKFIATTLAPELLTIQGRLSVLTIWMMMAVCAVYGATQLETNFAQSFFIPPGSGVEKYYNFDVEYFSTGFNVDIVVINEDIDYSSESIQY